MSFFWCALVCVIAVGSASAAPAKTKPKHKPAPKSVLDDCTKLMPAAELSSLSGGSFTLVTSRNIPASGLSDCGYNGTAQDTTNGVPADAIHTDVTFSIFAGPAAKALVAKEWKVYSQPGGSGKFCTTPAPGTDQVLADCVVQPVSGIGSQAAEFNDYIVVQQGTTLFQMWAGNNGAHHLSYAQLEAIATYLLGKIK